MEWKVSAFWELFFTKFLCLESNEHTSTSQRIWLHIFKKYIFMKSLCCYDHESLYCFFFFNIIMVLVNIKVVYCYQSPNATI